MAHHVSVGEVQDNHVLFPGADLADEFFGHFRGAHGRQKVIGGNLGAVHQDAFLVLEHGLAAAVEEEGYVGVFLGFRNAQLVFAGLGNGFSQGVLHQLFVKEDVHALEGSVVRGEAAVVQRKGVHPFFRHVLLGEDSGELAGAVVAEVVEDDGVAFLDGGHGLAVLRYHDGLDEFVRNIGIIAGLDTGLGAFECSALAFYQQVVGFFHAGPAFVAVHGIEAATHGSYLTGGFGHFLFQLLHESQAAVRVCVTAVHEGVDIHFVQSFFLGYAQEFVHVVQGAVHAAVGGKAHQMQLFAALLHIVIGCLYLFVFQQFVLTAGDIDLHQVLIHHAAGAQVHVAYLGVAHLAVRKAYIFPAGLQVRGRVFGAEGVNVGGTLGPDGVGVVVTAFAPAVQNHQKYFSVHIV